MQVGRLPQGILAIVAAAIGIWCLRAVYLLLGTSSALSWTSDTALVAILAASGLVCLFGAMLVLLRLADRPRVDVQNTQQFGRFAVGTQPSRPLLVPLLAVAGVVGIAALGTHQFGLLHATGQPVAGTEQQKAAEPVPSGSQAPPAAPATPSASTEDKTSPPPAAPEAPAPAEPTVAPPAPQETAAAPPAAAPPVENAPPAAPPVTTVPMPKPEPMPTQAEGHRDAVVWLSLAADGNSFLSASTDKTIKLWSIPDRKLVRTVASHPDMVRSAIFLPDGARIVTAGDDGEIVVRNLADGAPLHVFSAKDHGGVNKIAISPDGRRMVSGHEAGTVLFWDLEKLVPLHVERAHGWSVAGVAISDDGSRALSGSIDGDLKLWDVDEGTLLRYWGGHERGTYGMAFTHDGKFAVTGSGDRTIKLWDLQSGRLVRQFDGHSQTVYAIALSRDGTRILSGSLDGTARLWDLENGTEIAQYVGHRGPVYSVAFGPEGTVLTGGYDRSIRIWREAGPPAVAVLAGAPQ